MNDLTLWPKEEVKLLTQLLAEGKSASEIARTLGNRIRNAVIGKAHRLDLAPRATPIRRKCPPAGKRHYSDLPFLPKEAKPIPAAPSVMASKMLDERINAILRKGFGNEVKGQKVDTNHKEIVNAFRRLGWYVINLSGVGKGVPDILVSKVRFTCLVEIKNWIAPKADRKLTPQQEEFHREYPGSLIIVESVQDVIEFNKKHSR
jgi:hypothetical protein